MSYNNSYQSSPRYGDQDHNLYEGPYEREQERSTHLEGHQQYGGQGHFEQHQRAEGRFGEDGGRHSSGGGGGRGDYQEGGGRQYDNPEGHPPSRRQYGGEEAEQHAYGRPGYQGGGGRHGRDEQEQHYGESQHHRREEHEGDERHHAGSGHGGEGYSSSGYNASYEQPAQHQAYGSAQGQGHGSAQGQGYNSAPRPQHQSQQQQPRPEEDSSSPYPSSQTSASHQQQQQQQRWTSPYPPPVTSAGSSPYPPYDPSGAPSAYTSMPVHQHAPENQAGNYSNMSGQRKALLIGINYTGTSAELKGCHNDVDNLRDFIQERYGYPESGIKVLKDDGESEEPTRANMLGAMHWLTSDASPNDALFFHYSGHGSQVSTQEKDEADGLAETICPVDYEQEGQVTDDELHEALVKPLPKGCRLTIILDCCHSGSGADLPWMYDTKGQLKGPDHLTDLKSGALGAFKAYTSKDLGGMFSSLALTAKKVMTSEEAEKNSRKTKSSEADVVAWSGCKDDETSADAQEGGQATGAMSHAFVAALQKAPEQTYNQLLNTIRDELKGKYQQKPQLSCSHELDCDLKAVF